MGMQGAEVGVLDLVRAQAHLHGEVEHGALARRDVGLAVVHGHLVGHQRLFLVDAQDGSMRHHAVQALVGGAGGGHDHFAVALGQVTFLLEHQGIVVGKKGAPLRRSAGKGQKHVGDEAGLFLHLQDAGADVFGKVVQCGEGVAWVHGCRALQGGWGKNP